MNANMRPIPSYAQSTLCDTGEGMKKIPTEVLRIQSSAAFFPRDGTDAQLLLNLRLFVFISVS